MAFSIRAADYFHASLAERSGAANELLTLLAGEGVNLLAFTKVPTGPEQSQLTLFPEDSPKLAAVARHAQLPLDGPYRALLVRGDDELGAIGKILDTLARANVEVYSSSGIADGKGSFSYVVYVKPDHVDAAMSALEG